jgi:hypothetical protein
MTEIDTRELEAIRRFARRAGRTWKSSLRYSWERSSYAPASDDDAAILQRLRNTRGLVWLAGFKLPKE